MTGRPPTDEQCEPAPPGTTPPSSLDEETQRILLRFARDAITRHVRREPPMTFEQLGAPPHVAETLSELRGAFVTLTGGGALRGCIGHIIGDKPLIELIPEMAVAAATQDPRFPAVTDDEIDLLELEISVLTPPAPVADLETIEVGRHGLIVRQGRKTGLLLPQVPVDQGWNRRQFITYTCMKAGLAPDAWRDPETQFESFEAHVFSEAEDDSDSEGASKDVSQSDTQSVSRSQDGHTQS